MSELNPLVKENKKLAKTVILFAEWLFYVDGDMNIYPKVSLHSNMSNVPHNHWWYGDWSESTDNNVKILETDVEFYNANEVMKKYLGLTKYADDYVDEFE